MEYYFIHNPQLKNLQKQNTSFKEPELVIVYDLNHWLSFLVINKPFNSKIQSIEINCAIQETPSTILNYIYYIVGLVLCINNNDQSRHCFIIEYYFIQKILKLKLQGSKIYVCLMQEISSTKFQYILLQSCVRLFMCINNHDQSRHCFIMQYNFIHSPQLEILQ